jgi:hypothetical protein
VKNIVLVGVGVGLGFLVAHQASRTAAGAQLFDEVDATLTRVRGAIVDGYQLREAELRAAIAGRDESAGTGRRSF